MKRILLTLLLITFLSACSSHQAFRQANQAEEEENYDRAVAKYMEALSRDPGNARYKIHLGRVRLRASQAHFEKAKKMHEVGQLQPAIMEYQMAVQLDPTNQFAKIELHKALRAWEKQSESLTSLEKLKEKAHSNRGQPPKLNPKSVIPMSFSFPKPTEIKDIYQAFANAFGFNVIYDPQIKEKKITVELKEVTPEKALEITMRSGGHFYKVLDETTIIIAPDTPQMRKEYEDLLIQTFYLSNADVKDVNNILRSIMQARNVATNQQLNAVVIRDTADKVAIAKRIIDANDKAKAEVIIDVELIEVSTSKFKEMGINLSSYSYGFNYTGSEDGSASLGDFSGVKRDNWSVAIPSITLSFVKTIADGKTIAKPQLRVSEGEKAQLHIGDRIPIASAQFSGYGGSTGGTTQPNYGYQPYTSYQYTDVGVKIDIEPRVHHNREVTLKVKVESSSAQPSAGADSYTPPTISTRTINSVIRLKDGETSLLAGLIQDTSQHSKNGFPWLQDIPLLGPLFSNVSDNKKRNDLVLTLTPHIIRMPDITEEDLIPVWVGTENNMSIRGATTRLESGKEGPFDRKPQDKKSGAQSSDSDKGRGIGRRPFNKGNVTQGGAEGRTRKLHESPETAIPTFQFIKQESSIADITRTFTLQGSYDEDQRLASLLVEIDGPMEFEDASGIGDAEVVATPVSETRVRLDILLPQPAPRDGKLVIVRFLSTGDAPKALRINKGGSRDANKSLWPVSTAGISTP